MKGGGFGADAELADYIRADYIREELGYPGARQGAMVEKQKVDITTGEVEPGALVSADQPELRSVWAPRVAQAVPRPLEH